MAAGADVRVPKLWTPHRYQQTAVQFLHECTVLNPAGRGGAALFLDPGMGKSSIVLEYFRQLKEFGLCNRFLVVSPLRVMHNVWPDEIRGWSNFTGISYSVVHGTPEVRKKRLALPVNLHLINRDAISWLAKLYHNRSQLPWQGIIIDESTSFKNWSAARSKALRKFIERIPYRVIMTGTPAPKNLSDLFPQVWLLDEGQALGKTITEFRTNFCMQIGAREENNFRVRSEMEETIHSKIQHLALRLDHKDYLSIPPITYHDVPVTLPPSARRDYDAMEKQMLMVLATGDNKEAFNAAAKYQACKQISNGGVYDENHVAHEVHSAKTEATLEIIEELGGKPVLIAYQYEHDVARLQKAIPGLHVIRGGMKEADVASILDRWNTDTLDPPYLAVQPQALSYGVNAQHGSCRDIIWYGPTDSLDLYIQFNARIYRQGVGSAVRCHRLVCLDTIDQVIWDRTDEKEDVQTNLLEVLRAYAKKKLGF